MRARVITIKGESATVAQWAKKLGIPARVIHSRLHIGWTEAQAVQIKPGPRALKAEKTRAHKQARRRPVELVTHNGVTGTLAQVCRQFGYSYSLAAGRRNRGVPQSKWFDPPRRTVLD